MLRRKSMQRARIRLLSLGLICTLLAVMAMEPCANAQDSRWDTARKEAGLKNYEAAIDIYESILAEDPGNTTALNGKARVLNWMGDYESARFQFNEVLTRDPENIDSLTGLADTYARQENFVKAREVLHKKINMYPDNREILIRLTRYNLWTGRKKEAIQYADRMLEQSPKDGTAIKLKKQAHALRDYEYYAGQYYLDNNNFNSLNIYTGLRYKPNNKKYTLYGQFDYIDRASNTDGKIMGGMSLPLNTSFNIASEISLSPNASIYPAASGWVELSNSSLPSLVLYGRINMSHYTDVNLYGLSVAGEYYLSGQLALITRLTVSETVFDSGGSSTDEAISAKAIWFINDQDKVFMYYSYGSEAYKAETIDRIGGIKANTVGAGGTYFITPAIGVSPSLEFQDRERGSEHFQLGLEFIYRT